MRESKITNSQRLSYSINKKEREKKSINSINKQKSLKNNDTNFSVIINDNNAYKYINNTTRTATKNKDISLDVESQNNRKLFCKNSCNDMSNASKNKLKKNYNIGFNLEIDTNNRNTITASRDEEEYLGNFTKNNDNIKNDNKYNSLNSKDKNKILKKKSIKIKKKNEP